jgi:hypothetical protein
MCDTTDLAYLHKYSSLWSICDAYSITLEHPCNHADFPRA